MHTETKTISDLAAALDKHEKVCDERHKSIDRRFDGVNQRIDGLERRMDRFESKLDRLTWGVIVGMGSIVLTLAGSMFVLFTQLVNIAAGGSL